MGGAGVREKKLLNILSATKRWRFIKYKNPHSNLNYFARATARSFRVFFWQRRWGFEGGGEEVAVLFLILYGFKLSSDE